MKYVWLSQTEAASSLGISVSVFIGQWKTKLRDNAMTGKKKLYLIPYDEMIPTKQQQYKFNVIDDEMDANIDQLVAMTDFTNSREQLDIQEVRKRKIIAETEFLSQKITAKKEQLFAEWSEKFFIVFQKSFAKFKNSLIDLHLDDVQVKKLNQNLEFALLNMEIILSDIKQGYINDIVSDEQ